ncbi:DUF4870 domain-containing protein [Nesterenkonia sp. NBAIMH1]|uniref:DUF4870 domain-containing protein n=1 Tax=Nesterenkonia sp. NBAIMH1 TaxID=2600320 RepID=UPI00143CE998|nr:DUF4870 domain-containing protein [Nesterenkonia sp. NBAIMH1]
MTDYPPQHPDPAQPPVSPNDEKTMGILMHVLAIFFGFLSPLIFWLIFKDRSYVLDQQGRTALNWNISAMIYYVVSFILAFILIGFLTMLVIYVLHIIFSILAAVKASDRVIYKYPLSIPFLKLS